MEQIEKENCFQAGNPDELLYALQNKQDYILIQSHYQNDFLQNTQLPMPETSEMGLQLGLGGSGGLFGEIFYQLSKLFSKQNKQQKKIDYQIRKYIVKEMADKQLLLYLRQLDY